MQPARLEGARSVGGGAPPGQARPPARPPVPLARRGVRTCAASSKDQNRQGPAASASGSPAGAQRSRLARLLPWQSGAAPAGGEQAKPAAASASRSESLAAAPGAADVEGEQAVAAAALRLQQQPGEEPQRQGQGREQPLPQLSQQQAEASAAAARSGAFSLYSWLTWGSSGSPAGAATSSDSDAEEGGAALAGAAELADGMAAAPNSDLSGSGGRSSWRRWYGLSRASWSGSGSYDDGEAAPQRWQQRVPLDHPALQLLRQRALAGSAPGRRRDPFKLGLVVEGGGMRGCVSGGALQALTDLGLRECFDAVYGSSAGAINSTYFLSGQRSGVDIYHQHIACPEFINLRRLRWRGGGGGGGGASSASLSSVDEEPTPVLNLSFLIDHVMDEVHPLDWEAVLASPVPLKVVASSLDSLNPVLLHSFEGRDDLSMCLKASATVPEIAGGPRLHRGHRLVDAAVFEPVPFRSAIADGCTHLLVLCTRPVPLTRRSRVNSYLADAMEVAIKKAVLSPDYMVPAWKAELEYLAKDGLTQDDQLLKAATQEDAHELPWFAGAHVLPLYPGAAANFSPLCIDPPTLRAGVAEGRRTVLAVCRALLGDAWDFSRFPELESSNIVPTRSPSSSSARLWRRYFADDFSTHA